MDKETAKARDRLGVFCKGVGLDLGWGGDPISASAIKVDMSDFPGTNIVGDASNLVWFQNEWFRVLKPEGVLVLYLPTEQVYREFCLKNNLERNVKHKNEAFSLEFLKGILKEHFKGRYEIIHSTELSEDYCFDLVIKKVKEA